MPADNYEIPEWPYAYGGPCGEGRLRARAEDFIVKETLGFQPAGSGEHCFLQIQKCGENTDYVAKQLAKYAGTAPRHVGYAGLKDRLALTTQWFSVWLPGKSDPDWQGFNSETIKVINNTRHTKKLKRGSLAANEFTITVRHVEGDRGKIEQLFARVKQFGVPNYFGPQRFGMNGQNVNRALSLLQGRKVKRQQRSLYLSAARSFLFNHILSERVQNHSWDTALPGDAFCFNRSNKFFCSENIDEDIKQRLQTGQIHPTGCLWGKGESAVKQECLAIESAVIQHHHALARLLQQTGVELARRALRVNIADMQWHYPDEQTFTVQFSLASGSYATAVLREIIRF